jgi:hypothetical protein
MGYLSRYSDWIRAGRFGNRIPIRARFFAHVQTGSGAHPSSYTMGNGSFPRKKRPGRDADHTPRRGHERGELYFDPPSGSVQACNGTAVPFSLYVQYLSHLPQSTQLMQAFITTTKNYRLKMRSRNIDEPKPNCWSAVLTLHHHHHHHHHHHNQQQQQQHQWLGYLARSVSRVTAALSNVSSVSQPFSFLVGCSGIISKGFGLCG